MEIRVDERGAPSVLLPRPCSHPPSKPLTFKGLTSLGSVCQAGCGGSTLIFHLLLCVIRPHFYLLSQSNEWQKHQQYEDLKMFQWPRHTHRLMLIDCLTLLEAWCGSASSDYKKMMLWFCLHFCLSRLRFLSSSLTRSLLFTAHPLLVYTEGCCTPVIGCWERYLTWDNNK